MRPLMALTWASMPIHSLFILQNESAFSHYEFIFGILILLRHCCFSMIFSKFKPAEMCILSIYTVHAKPSHRNITQLWPVTLSVCMCAHKQNGPFVAFKAFISICYSISFNVILGLHLRHIKESVCACVCVFNEVIGLENTKPKVFVESIYRQLGMWEKEILLVI